MLISPAFAQAGGAGGGDMFVQLMPLLLIFVVFWFFLIRPQQKKAKEHREMIGSLKKGDRIITTGGLYGRITGMDDATLTVEISDKVRVKISRGNITSVIRPADKTQVAKNVKSPDKK